VARGLSRARGGEDVGTRARRWLAAGLVAAAALAAGCSPEVGSDGWCEMMKEKPKGDWSANEAADYAKHCLFGSRAGGGSEP